MPKFLDAPSWYDDNGDLKTIQGDFRISIGGGYNVAFDVPWVDGTNTSSLPSQTYYLLPGSTSGRIPYFSSTTVGYQALSSGTSGQVLKSNGSGTTPSWSTPRYVHFCKCSHATAPLDWTYIWFTYLSTSSTPHDSFSNMLSDILRVYGTASSGTYKIPASGYFYHDNSSDPNFAIALCLGVRNPSLMEVLGKPITSGADTATLDLTTTTSFSDNVVANLIA